MHTNSFTNAELKRYLFGVYMVRKESRQVQEKVKGKSEINETNLQSQLKSITKFQNLTTRTHNFFIALKWQTKPLVLR